MQNFMKIALKQAEKAFLNGEVPVGAVVVKDGKVISRSYNKRETAQNALYHAEILAIDKACKKLKSFRLDDCEMYVTLEPCVMCSGAIANARIKKVVFGAKDENLAFSCAEILQNKHLEKKVEVISNENEKECKDILLRFFKKVRDKNAEKKVLGKNICEKTFVFSLEKMKFCEVESGQVVAVIEDIKSMNTIPVICENFLKREAKEIFEFINKSEFGKKRIKIVTLWGEKKYFN
ncbi:MAG: nucleoside deaminase [Clostridia bacterium]|nr:nucleoside deaminase [Clostridia bacterium]